MLNYIYETHNMDALLPFIFHNITLHEHIQDMSNWHRNMELICCYRGEGDVNCTGEVLHLTPGDIGVINSDVVHACGTKGNFSYYCLIIDCSFCQANGLHIEDLRFKPIVQNPTLAEKFIKIDNAFSEYKKDNKLQHILTIRCQVLEILRILYTHYLAEETHVADFAKQERIKRTMSYIRQNLTDEFTLEKIADYIGISKFHLSREFKKITGTTIIEFINLTRCAEAKRLIEEGKSVTAAAVACGYENISYFTRVFKKCYGMLPSALQHR